MAALGSLLVSLAVDTARFQSDLGRAAQKMQGFARDAAKVGAAVGAMATAAAGAMAVMVKGAIDAADANIKLAQGAGVSVETLTSLGYAAQLSGSSTEALGRTLGRLGKSIADAANGTGEASRAFDVMGINVRDANGQLKSSDQIFREVADRFSQYQDGAAKSALAMQIFGREGASLIPMLNAGSAGLAAMEEEARSLGVTVDTNTAKAAEAFNDNLTHLSKVKEGLVNRIARELLPTLQNMTDRMFASAKASGALDQAARAAAAGVRILLSVGAIVVGVFQTVGQALGGVAASLVALFSGRFREAFEIGRNVALDFAGNIRSIANTVAAVWDGTAQSIAGSASSNGGRIAAPIIEAADRTSAAGRAIRQEVDRVQESIQRVMGSINRDVATLGMSGTQVRLFDLAGMGASPQQLEQARQMLALIDDFEARNRSVAEAQSMQQALMEEGRRIYEQTRTPLEQLNASYARLNQLYQDGAFGAVGSAAAYETLARALQQADEAFQSATQTINEMDVFSKRAAENIQSYLGSTLADVMNGNFKNIGQGFTQMLNRMVSEAMAANLARYFFGDMVGGTGSGVLGGTLQRFVGSIFGGRASGGPVSPHTPYLVGEHGPELFVPATAGNVNASAGMTLNVTQNFTLQGQTDRRTQMQLAADAQRGLIRAQRNL